MSAVGSIQDDALVRFLCKPSHLGAHVAQKEEADGGNRHDDLSNPEGRVPAVLLGNGAEGKARHKSSN